MHILGIIGGWGTFMFSGPFWEYLNSLLWTTVMIYIAKILVSLHSCVLETLDRIF